MTKVVTMMRQQIQVPEGLPFTFLSNKSREESRGEGDSEKIHSIKSLYNA